MLLAFAVVMFDDESDDPWRKGGVGGFLDLRGWSTFAAVKFL